MLKGVKLDQQTAEGTNHELIPNTNLQISCFSHPKEMNFRSFKPKFFFARNSAMNDARKGYKKPWR